MDDRIGGAVDLQPFPGLNHPIGQQCVVSLARSTNVGTKDSAGEAGSWFATAMIVSTPRMRVSCSIEPWMTDD